MRSDNLFQFCKDHENDDVHKLALQAKNYPEIDMVQALQQIKGLQIAKYKIPLWYSCDKILYPIHLSLEQCSSEETALYKQQIAIKGDTMVDLTGGLGVDTAFLSPNFRKVHYVEQQESLTELASHNFSALDLADKIEIANEDSVEFLQEMDPVDFIYIDPARRDTKGQKTALIEDCTPNLLEIQHLLDSKAKQVMIKLSPMLDITLALQSLTNISEVHIVSVDNECKELLFIKNNKEIVKEPRIHCVNLSSEKEVFIFLKSEEENTSANYTSSPEKYLYEPNTSLMKAGAYKILCEKYSIKKLHPSSHLYTSDILISNFPGRKFEIQQLSSLNKKDIKRDFADISQANVATRNFPLKAEELKKRLNLKDGGDIFIFGSTLADNQKVIFICKKI